MLKNVLSGLLVAGLCCVPAFAHDEVHHLHHDADHTHLMVPSVGNDLGKQMWRDNPSLGRDADDIRSWDAEHHHHVESPRVLGRTESIPIQTEVRSSDSNEVASSSTIASDSSDEPKADRVGPVPFADLGRVGGSDQTLKTPDAIEQDKRLLVRGEERGDDIILHLPAGTKMDTLSLRSSGGLDLRHAELMAFSRIDGDDLIISKSGLDGRDLNNLWIWGTGPESASLLQRVAMGEIQNREIATAGEATEEVREE